MKFEKNTQFPKLQKNLKAFLNEEEGRIAKKSVKKISVGLFIAGAAVAGLIKADPSLADCAHNNHSSHVSHSQSYSHGGWC